MMKVLLLLFMSVIMTSIVALQVKIQDLIPVQAEELLLPASFSSENEEHEENGNTTTQIFLQQQTARAATLCTEVKSYNAEYGKSLPIKFGAGHTLQSCQKACLMRADCYMYTSYSNGICVGATFDEAVAVGRELQKSWVFEEGFVSGFCRNHGRNEGSIYDILAQMKKSIQDSATSAIDTAAARCTADTTAKVVKVEKTFVDGTSVYGDLQGCAADSQCEKATEEQQNLAIAAKKQLAILNTNEENMKDEQEELEKDITKNREEHADLEEEEQLGIAQHTVRLKHFDRAIKALKKLESCAKRTGRLQCPSSSSFLAEENGKVSSSSSSSALVSEEERASIGKFKLAKAMLLMLHQASSGVNQKEIVNKLLDLLASLLISLDTSRRSEVTKHQTWKDDFMAAKKKAKKDAISRATTEAGTIAERRLANDLLIKAQEKKLKDALSTGTEEIELCVKQHKIFVDGQGNFDSEMKAIDKMIEILKEAKLDAETAVIRDETEDTKHGVDESVHTGRQGKVSYAGKESAMCRGVGWTATQQGDLSNSECEAKCTADSACTAYDRNNKTNSCFLHWTEKPEYAQTGPEVTCYIKQSQSES